jgi:hypothetical protein
MPPYACLDAMAEEKTMQARPIDRKDRLHENFIAALDLLDAEQREPDRWEEECLSYALGAMACGMYLVAEVELAAFRRPLAERSPEVIATLAAKPARFTKAMLRHGLDYVQQHYGQPRVADRDVPPALAAGQLDFQSSLAALSR